MTLTLRQMRYCLALAETGHFGKAAEASAITQPALSQQIALVEAEVGAPLFDRLGRTVQPTELGREVLALARDVVACADALERFIVRQAGAPAGPIRFGLIPTVAPYLLPEIFPHLQPQDGPQRFQISENRTEALLAGLADGSLDLALIATTPPSAGLRLDVEPLFEDPFVLAISTREAEDTPIPLGAIATERMLLLDEGHCFRDQAIAACSLTPEHHKRVFAATSLSTIVEFVASGQGITLLPEIALRKEAADPRIAIRRLVAPGAGRTLQLVWRHGHRRAAEFRDIAQLIRETRTKSD
ncbi:hydrogen peroxide-inducible genes activator [Arsenicitalea aurantiaca]|uniref:Hydrogen peroxide-inducible genes activator n=1 Tax=Arsenicitalea aurantiaca TaxID=1783274 RepID=A0A433XLZ1_9HYPH|nr:hydrogen peroxide-inducible genes activator [Arsenicitalea aurantiaca]RUT35107.1 hydrogen peroxide-inducible genes activator [Arsenicitalea aurantiaca]